MPRNPFKPLSPRKSIVSDHPKSIFDRQSSHSKSGLELARRRDLSAFRTSKSRKLKALRGSAKWQTLSESERHDAEAEIIAALDQQLAEKTRIHTLQWRQLFEKGEVSENDADDEKEADDDDAMLLDSSVDARSTGEEDSDEGEVGWVTDSEEELDDEELRLLSIVPETTLREFREVREASGKEWWEKMKKIEDTAAAQERQWRDMLSE